MLLLLDTVVLHADTTVLQNVYVCNDLPRLYLVKKEKTLGQYKEFPFFVATIPATTCE